MPPVRRDDDGNSSEAEIRSRVLKGRGPSGGTGTGGGSNTNPK